MNKVCTFIGHSMFVKCRLSMEELKNTIENLINNGVKTFLIGSHGEFDEMCLDVCCSLKNEYKNIKIFKVCTNLQTIMKENNYNENIEIISYPIENFHYKQQITKSNEMMIDSANLIISYVNEMNFNSGALKSLKYAKKKNKNIINLFKI